MNLKTNRTQVSEAADEDAICAIHKRMIEAWNAADGTDFASPFTDDADFVVWDGTHLKGQQELALFTQQIFETVMKGSRLEGEVKFVRFLSPALAVMHSLVRVTLPGQIEASRSRDSMELTILRKHGEEWRAEGLMNARRLSIERQLFLDEIDSLPQEVQRELSDLVASLKKVSSLKSRLVRIRAWHPHCSFLGV